MNCSKYDKCFKDVGKPVDSKYPEIVIDDVNNTKRIQTIPLTTEMLYDLLHHTHTADSLVGSTDSGSNTGDEGDSGDLDTDFLALLDIIGQLTAVVGSLGGDVDSIVETIESLGGTVPDYESPDDTEPEPDDEPEPDEEVDKTALEELINSANSLNEEDYTPNSWSDLSATLTTAEYVYNNEDATQEEVDEVTGYLQTAIDTLVKVADKTALLELFSTLDSYDLNEADYTPSTWNAYSTVLGAALNVYEDGNATQEEVDDVLESLQNAFDALVKVADKSALEELLNSVADMNEEDYTPSSWALLTAELDAAQAVYDDTEVSQTIVDETTEILQTIIDSLVLRADKTELAGLIDSVNDLDQDNYIPSSWSELQTILAEAKEIYDDAEASQDTVNEIVWVLKDMIDALIERPDKTTLGELIDSVNDLDESVYTTDSWEALESALATAKEVYNNEDADQEEVNEAANYLSEAISNLVIYVDKSALEATITAAELLDESDYTAETWEPFAETLNSAKEVYLNDSATQEEVNIMNEYLTEAMNNLQAIDFHATVVDENGNEVKCETLADAVSAVADGGTVNIIEDTELDEQLVIDKSMTINLNGCTISGDVSSSMVKVNNTSSDKISVTFNNGSIDLTTTATDTYYRALALYGNVDATLTNMDIDATSTFYGYGVSVGATDQEYSPVVTIGSGCTVVGGYCGVMIATNNNNDDDPTTVIVEDGASITGAFGISGNGTYNTTLIINGGSVSSSHEEGCGIYNPQHGTVIINGGTITGPTGIEMCDGSLTINGGTITSTDTDHRSTTTSTSGNVCDGAAVSLIHRSGYAEEDDEPKMVMTGGTLISEQAAAFLAYGWNKASEVDWDDKDITITGGSFSDKSAEEYLSDDYTLTEDDGLYTVTKN